LRRRFRIKRQPFGIGAGSLGQVRPSQRAIFSFLSDGPVGMSKRSVSITCFLGTRKGVLTKRASTPSSGDLEPERRFDKRLFRLFRGFSTGFSSPT
jgi:hypothetical protein